MHTKILEIPTHTDPIQTLHTLKKQELVFNRDYLIQKIPQGLSGKIVETTTKLATEFENWFEIPGEVDDHHFGQSVFKPSFKYYFELHQVLDDVFRSSKTIRNWQTIGTKMIRSRVTYSKAFKKASNIFFSYWHTILRNTREIAS